MYAYVILPSGLRLNKPDTLTVVCQNNFVRRRRWTAAAVAIMIVREIDLYPLPFITRNYLRF